MEFKTIMADRTVKFWKEMLGLGAVAGVMLSFLFFWFLAKLASGYGLPADAFLSGYSGRAIGVSLLAIFIASVGPGLVIGSLAVWSIPQAKMVLEADAKEAGFANYLLVFRRMVSISVLGLLSFGIIAALYGWSWFGLTKDAIYSRGYSSIQPRTYLWSDVVAVDTSCGILASSGRRSAKLHTSYKLTLRNKTSVDISSSNPGAFIAAYPQLRTALGGRVFRFNYQVGSLGDNELQACPAQLERYFRLDPSEQLVQPR